MNENREIDLTLQQIAKKAENYTNLKLGQVQKRLVDLETKPLTTIPGKPHLSGQQSTPQPRLPRGKRELARLIGSPPPSGRRGWGVEGVTTFVGCTP